MAARRVKSARGRFFHYTVGIRAARFLDQRPRLFVANRLDNVPRLVEHLDFADHSRRVAVRSSALNRARVRRSKSSKRPQLRKLPSRLVFASGDP